jgi:hypothetical protein
MKKYKITVKLINVEHEEWIPYMHNIMEEFKITFSMHKDTYVCMGDDDVMKQIDIVADIFESKGQTVLINCGGI